MLEIDPYMWIVLSFNILGSYIFMHFQFILLISLISVVVINTLYYNAYLYPQDSNRSDVPNLERGENEQKLVMIRHSGCCRISVEVERWKTNVFLCTIKSWSSWIIRRKWGLLVKMHGETIALWPRKSFSLLVSWENPKRIKARRSYKDDQKGLMLTQKLKKIVIHKLWSVSTR